MFEVVMLWVFLMTGVYIGSRMVYPLDLSLPKRRPHPTQPGVSHPEDYLDRQYVRPAAPHYNPYAQAPGVAFHTPLEEMLLSEDDSPKSSKMRQYLEEMRQEGWDPEKDTEPWLS